MDDEQIKEIVNGLLTEKSKVWKLKEIEDYLKPYKVNNKNMMKIVESLVNNFVFKWLDFICLKLPELAVEKSFVSLLRKIIQKTKGDMSQGHFIRALIKIGEENPSLGFSLYGQLAEEDKDIVFYSSFPLGGAGRKDFDKAYSFVQEGLKSENHQLKAACIKALRVIFEDETELQKPSEILEILDRFSSENQDIIVQLEVLHAYVDFSRFQRVQCTQHLVEFSKRKNPVIRFSLANIIGFQDLPSKEDEIKILMICAEDEDVNVLSRVSLALSRKGQEFPEKALRIIRSWIKRGKYYNIYGIDYSLKEIGKVHLDRCIKEVERWIPEACEDKKLQFHIPMLLEKLSSSNYMQMIEGMKLWLSLDSIFPNMVIQTIRRVLTEIYPLQADRVRLVDSCFTILEKMVKEKNGDIEKIVRGEPNRLFQCFRLIEELKTERKELNFEKIVENLKKYPAIHDFLGDSWFERMEKEKNQTHQLLIYLSLPSLDEEKLLIEVKAFRKETNEFKRYLKSLHIREMLRPSAFLGYLEDILQLVVSKSKKLKDLRAGLRNENQFWETLSEVEVTSSLMRDHKVEIAPKLNQKKLDVQVDFNGSTLLIEVISPNRFKPLRYLTGKAMGIKNRARDKVFDEFKNHLKGIEIGDTLIAIAIDIGHSEINYSFVEEYLVGTPQLTMLFDKEKGEVVKTFPSRAKDAMHILEEETDILSAIIPYKTYLGKDRKFHREGRVMLNPHARNPIGSDIVRKIENSLFN